MLILLWQQKMMMERTTSEEERLKEGPGVLALCRTPNMRLKTILITFNWLVRPSYSRLENVLNFRAVSILFIFVKYSSREACLYNIVTCNIKFSTKDY